MMCGSIGNAVIEAALDWRGTPYRHQASTKGVGCDCLGLIRGVWRDLYGSEPEALASYSMDWAETAEGDPLLEAARRHFHPLTEPEPGALLLFRWKPGLPAKHCGIHLGNMRFMHAYERRCVTDSPLVPQWRRKLAGVFQFPSKTIGV